MSSVRGRPGRDHRRARRRVTTVLPTQCGDRMGRCASGTPAPVPPSRCRYCLGPVKGNIPAALDVEQAACESGGERRPDRGGWRRGLVRCRPAAPTPTRRCWNVPLGGRVPSGRSHEPQRDGVGAADPDDVLDSVAATPRARPAHRPPRAHTACEAHHRGSGQRRVRRPNGDRSATQPLRRPVHPRRAPNGITPRRGPPR